MPVFLMSLLGGLINIAGTLAGQALIGLGIAVVTYQGMDTTLTWLKGQIVSNVQTLPADMIGIISYMGVGQSISIIFSAYVVRVTLDGLTGGSMKKWVMK